MGKKRRKKKLKREASKANLSEPAESISWQDAGGVHFVSPGLPPTAEKVAKMTKEYQNQIRNSPLWDDMVKQFGLKEAKEMLKDFKVEIKPGMF